MLKGTFKFVDTYGLPLDLMIDAMDQRGYMVDWVDFIEESKEKGWPLHRTTHRLQEAVSDVYGPEFWKHWENRLREFGYTVPGGDP